MPEIECSLSLRIGRKPMDGTTMNALEMLEIAIRRVIKDV